VRATHTRLAISLFTVIDLQTGIPLTGRQSITRIGYVCGFKCDIEATPPPLIHAVFPPSSSAVLGSSVQSNLSVFFFRWFSPSLSLYHFRTSAGPQNKLNPSASPPDPKNFACMETASNPIDWERFSLQQRKRETAAKQKREPPKWVRGWRLFPLLGSM
jgi:hypothetical protein